VSFACSMMGQQTISPGGHLNKSLMSEHQHLGAADIVAMLHGLSAEQQHEFYQAIGLEHEEQFYSMLGLCPSTNYSLHSQTVRHVQPTANTVCPSSDISHTTTSIVSSSSTSIIRTYLFQTKIRKPTYISESDPSCNFPPSSTGRAKKVNPIPSC